MLIGCRTRRAGHDLDHLDLTLPFCGTVRDLCRICTGQIQPRKNVLDYADFVAPTRQHELDHTDHTDQGSIFPAWQISRSLTLVGIDGLYDE